MWAIYNSVKGWTLYKLSLREVQLIVSTLTLNEVKLTRITALNSNQWENLSRDTHPDFFSEVGKESTGFPEYKIAESTLEADTDFFVIKPQKKYLARLHDRIDANVKVVIEGQNKSFESITIDLSEGGLYFKDTIPEWVSGYFIVRVFDAKTFYQVICSLVEDQKVKQRVQIVSEENDIHYLKYKEWLKSL